ncbi:MULTISPECIES: hypothetical protein [unclassified Mesorhizobium]|uniref:hypothetical protein n=1 Tax=unclassified Mesorhizobium TaxID=325217 RepID=UPI00117D90C3|nr:MULTISPECIES: hypothetical protein [unclassified Mesorhizobium]
MDIASEFKGTNAQEWSPRQQLLRTGAESRRRLTKDHQRLSRGRPMNRCKSSFAILAFGTFCTSSTIAMAAHSTICSAPDKSVAIVVLATPG